MANEPWTFTNNEPDAVLPLDEAVAQAIGAASTCWTELAPDGEFDSRKATQIVNTLVKYLEMYHLGIRDNGNTILSEPGAYCLSPATLAAVNAEFNRAVRKHGYDRTPATTQLTDGEKLPLLGEEFGEVCRAMTYDEGDPDKLDAELIQVATMAAAWYEGRQAQKALRERVGRGDGVGGAVVELPL